MGGHRFEATEDERATVKLLAAGGLSPERICYCIQRKGKPISPITLRKHFASELLFAKSEVDKIILSQFLKAATEGKQWAIDKWLSQRMWRDGWRDPPAQHAVMVHPVTGEQLMGSAENGALPPLSLDVHFIKPDPSKRPDLGSEAVFTPMTPTEVDKAETLDAKPSQEPEPHQPTYEAGVRPSYGRKDVRRDKAGNKVDMCHDPADPAYADRPPGTRGGWQSS